jgi:hypothetical protein
MISTMRTRKNMLEEMRMRRKKEDEVKDDKKRRKEKKRKIDPAEFNFIYQRRAGVHEVNVTSYTRRKSAKEEKRKGEDFADQQVDK